MIRTGTSSTRADAGTRRWTGDSRGRSASFPTPSGTRPQPGARTAECDVFLATNSYVTPWFLRIPTALVVHDLIPFQEGIHANRRAALIERLTIHRALRRAAVIICDSHSTRRDLLRLAPKVEGKSSVVQLAADRAFARMRDKAELAEVRRRHGLSRPFVLCTGTLEPRKNLVRVLDAFGRLPEGLRAEHELALVGPRGWEFEEILQPRGRSRARARARFRGRPRRPLPGV